MLPLLACALALQAPIIQPPRLRTILPNGAVVLVQSEPTAKRLRLQLFISSAPFPDTESTYGYRHLLEHLIAKGVHKDLDKRLETHAAFLTAQTLRQATNFTIDLRPTDLALGVSAIAELLQLGAITQDDIVKEASIIRQEEALEEAPFKLSKVAWSTAFGEKGLDPMGDPDVIQRATPESLLSAHRLEFVGPGIVLVVSGPVDLDDATKASVAVVGLTPSGASTTLKPLVGLSGASTASVSGLARAAIVKDIEDPMTVACLAAALGLASETTDSFVTYTPSEQGGLVVLGQTGHASDLGHIVDTTDPAAIFARGRALARRWIERQVDGDNDDGYLRGLLMVQAPGLRPDTLESNLDNMTFAQFQSAMRAFKAPKCVSVNGQ